MNWADYQPGRRVVCVGDFSGRLKWCTVVPEKGTVYTIRTANMGKTSGGRDVLGLTFAEMVSHGHLNARYQPTHGEWRFHADHFKPLDERRIDQFRAILTKAPAPWGSEPVAA